MWDFGCESFEGRTAGGDGIVEGDLTGRMLFKWVWKFALGLPNSLIRAPRYVTRSEYPGYLPRNTPPCQLYCTQVQLDKGGALRGR